MLLECLHLIVVEGLEGDRSPANGAIVGGFDFEILLLLSAVFQRRSGIHRRFLSRDYFLGFFCFPMAVGSCCELDPFSSFINTPRYIYRPICINTVIYDIYYSARVYTFTFVTCEFCAGQNTFLYVEGRSVYLHDFVGF